MKIRVLILQLCFINTEALLRSCSVKMMLLKISKIYKKVPVSESCFEKIRRRRLRLQDRCFLESFAKFSRRRILKNFCERLFTILFYENEPPPPKG